LRSGHFLQRFCSRYFLQHDPDFLFALDGLLTANLSSSVVAAQAAVASVAGAICLAMAANSLSISISDCP
jgi:hypothetical protein